MGHQTHNRRSLVFVLLCGLQTLAIAGFNVAATIEIEAIIFAALTLTCLGLVITWSAWKNVHGVPSIVFGLACPIFFTIGLWLLLDRRTVVHWKRDEESIRWTFLAFVLFASPLGIFVIAKTNRLLRPLASAPIQFNIRTSLVAVSLLAVSLAVCQAIRDIAPGGMPIAASMLFTINLFGVSTVLMLRIHRDNPLSRRRAMTVAALTAGVLLVFVGTLRTFFHATNEGRLRFISKNAYRVEMVKDGIPVRTFDVRADSTAYDIGGWNVPAGEWEFRVSGNPSNVRLSATKLSFLRGQRKSIRILDEPE